MTADVAIYEALKDAVDNVYYNKFPQGIKVTEPTAKVLLQNVTHGVTNTKEGIAREEYTYRVTILGTNYINVCAAAEDVKAFMVGFTDSNIYLCIYEGGTYDTQDELEVHRIVHDYRTFINQPNVS
jgi:hypothetical protein